MVSARTLTATATVALIGLVAGIAAGPLGAGLQAATAAPPAPPRVVYTEDFQNANVSTNAQAIGGYTGAPAAQSTTYTASPNWNGTNCNGWVVNGNTAVPPASDPCLSNGGASNLSFRWNKSGAIAVALARGESAAAAQTNNALTAWTAPVNNVGTMLLSQQVIPMVNGRFYNVAANYGTLIENGSTTNPPGVGCDGADPLITLQLTDGVNAFTIANNLNPCTVFGVQVPAPQAPSPGSVWHVAHLTGTALRWSGSSTAAIKLINNQPSGLGNDSVFDDPEVIDVTPQLEKSFSPSDIGIGQISTLTFTVTNTAELGAKTGWSLTDTFGSGLIRADNAVGGTCQGATAPGGSGDTAVTVSGSIFDGEAECTVTIHVTMNRVGTVINDAGNISPLNGLVPPTVGTEITGSLQPALEIAKSSTTIAADHAGQSIPYDIAVTNTGNVTLTDVIIADPLPGLSPLDYAWPAAPGILLPGQSVTAVAGYRLAQADLSLGAVDNRATATATAPDGSAVTSAPASTTTPLVPAIVPTPPAAVTSVAGLAATGSDDSPFVAALALMLGLCGCLIVVRDTRRGRSVRRH